MQGEILSCRFDPTGQNIAACSADRSVCAYNHFLPFILLIRPHTALWRTYPPHSNYALLSSLTKAPILDLQWSLAHPHIYTVSADHTMLTLDVTTGQRIRKVRAHREIINSVDRCVFLLSGAKK
jgi:Prp8 binding protein